MSRSNFTWSNFLGGEVSPLAQGRTDQPWYSSSMNVCLNSYPIEEGCWVRRMGTNFIVPTRLRKYAKILPFVSSETCAFIMVFTDDNLQFVTQSSVIFDGVATVASSDVSTFELTMSAATGWSQGDQVMIVFPDVASALFPYQIDQQVGLRNRMLTINTITGTPSVITLADDLGNLTPPFDGSVTWPTDALVGSAIVHVKNFTTPYATQAVLDGLRSVQADAQTLVLCNTQPVKTVQVQTPGVPGPSGTDPIFTSPVRTSLTAPISTRFWPAPTPGYRDDLSLHGHGIADHDLDNSIRFYRCRPHGSGLLSAGALGFRHDLHLRGNGYGQQWRLVDFDRAGHVC